MKSIYFLTRISKQLTFFLFTCLLLGISAEVKAQACQELIWSDEFNGTTLDTSLWSYDIGDGCPDLCGWGNNEQQYYSNTSQNIKVENGNLIITGREDTLGGLEYSSAKIKSKGKGDFRYGRFEARMRFPSTQGVWPAFWMLPTQNVYGTWPSSGEIDIVEMIGKNPGQAVGTVHTGMPYVYKPGYYNLTSGEIFADNFHVFAIEWEPNSITWFVDGIQYHHLTPSDIGPWAPFQEEFYIILNLALGGNWPGDIDNSTVLPQTLEVDYVRVYNRPNRLPIRGVQPIVEAKGLTYSTFDIAGANYIWTVPSDAKITSGQSTHQITVDWGCNLADIELELQTVCDTVFLSFAIDSFITLPISGPAVVMENESSVTYALAQESSGTFTWAVPAGASILSGQGSNKIEVKWGCNSGEVIVSFNNSCGIVQNDTLPVALKTYKILGQASIPANTSYRTYSIAEISGATYNWSVLSDVSILSGQGTRSILIDFGTTNGTISVEVVTSCGTKNYDLPFVIEDTYVYADFDEINLPFVAYSGAVLTEVDNPSPSGINMSNRVGRVNKTPGAYYYAGIESDVYEIALDIRPIMSQKVYSSSTGTVRFMLDDLTTGYEKLKIGLEYGPDDVNKWVRLVYDFTGSRPEVYDQIGLTFNHGSTTTEYWYVDDVMGHKNAILSTNPKETVSEVITVYPNPSAGLFSVDTKNIFSAVSSYNLEVIDLQGRIVLSKEVIANGEQITFDISNQPTGLYFLHLSGQSLHYVKAINKR